MTATFKITQNNYLEISAPEKTHRVRGVINITEIWLEYEPYL